MAFGWKRRPFSSSDADMGVNMDGAMEPRVQFQRMSPFSGLEDTNPGLTGALLGFSFHTGKCLSCGD